jgi:hypothetical protein
MINEKGARKSSQKACKITNEYFIEVVNSHSLPSSLVEFTCVEGQNTMK